MAKNKGPKKTVKTKMLTLRIEPETLEGLKKRSKQLDRSVSYIVNRMIKENLK